MGWQHPAPLQVSNPYQHPIFFVLFAPLADVAKGGDGAKSAFCGYSVLESATANGTSVLNHFAKLSFTDSGANSAMRLV
jgi:hypothetical protein